MTMERALFEKLKTTPIPSDSIYAMRAPQNAAPPFVIYQRVSSERWRDINGPSGMVQAMMQIDTYGATYYQAKDLSLKIEQLLDGFRGTVDYIEAGGASEIFIFGLEDGSGSIELEDGGGLITTEDTSLKTVRFGGISCQNDVDLFDQTDEPFLYRVSADYLVTYEQS